MKQTNRVTAACWTSSLAMKMEAVYSSETLVKFYPSTRCHIIENNILLLPFSLFIELFFRRFEISNSLMPVVIVIVGAVVILRNYFLKRI
jgi:glycopeptide antibiotics resistance protein